MNNTNNSSRIGVLALTCLLAACGGGDDPAPAASSSSGTTTTVTAAALMVVAASPATVNGTLDKASALGQESGISDATGNFSSAGPNDYCRVASYALTDSGNARRYDVQVVYAKSNRAVVFVGLSDNAGAATFSARANGTTGSPLSSVAVDTANRRIGFTNTVLGAGANAATLNGSLEYPTNAVMADRSSCG